MKLLFILFLLSCSSSTILINYNDSNFVFLSSTIEKLQFAEKINSIIPRNSKIILINMDNSNEDHPVTAMIHDYLSKCFVTNNYQLLERDSDLIKQLAYERFSSTYQLFQEQSLKNFRKINISSADYTVAYRILECGIFTSSIDNSYANRESLVRLHIRIINSKSAKIIHIRNIASIQNDKVNKEILPFLENYNFTFYPATYPSIQKEENK